MLTVNNLNNLQATYTPGKGYSAKVASNVSIIWGQEVRDQLEADYAQMQEVKKNASRFDRAELTDEDVASLAEQFDPRSMTQEEYDAFLQTLVDKKVLSQQELQFAGYKGMVTDLSFDRLTDCTGMSMSQVMGMKSGLSLFGIYGMDGDVRAWANVMDLRSSSGRDDNTMYHAMLNVLDRMADHR